MQDIQEAAQLIASMMNGDIPEVVDFAHLNGHGEAIATLIEARKTSQERFNFTLAPILEADPVLNLTIAKLSRTPEIGTARKPLRWYTAKQMIARSVPPPILELDGVVIPDKAITALAGQAGKGKSFISLHWAMALSQKYPVIYVAAEKAVLFGDRMLAWSKHHNKPIENRPYFVDGAVVMNDPDQVDQFIYEAKQQEQPIRAVFIDTLARCMDGDENNGEDMGNFVKGCERVRRELDCAVIVVHHLGKDVTRGMRGSNRLECDIDAVVMLSSKDGVITLKNTKQSSMEDFKDVAFRLQIINLETDKAERPKTSCVAVPAVQPEEGKKSAYLAANQVNVLRVLASVPDGFRHADIMRVTSLAKASVNGAVAKLIKREFISYDKPTRKYHILEAGMDYHRESGAPNQVVRSSGSSESDNAEPNK